MIHVDRSPIPAILREKGPQWLRDLQGASRPSDRARIRKRYGSKGIKSALQAMFHGKCAYCESKVPHVDFGDVEHYRPKAGPRGRPDLVFDWDNLLLACGICNSQFKRDQFPEAEEGGPILNPCTDEPRDHLTFHFDGDTRVASVYGTTTRGRTTETLIGLNRRDLRRYRSAYLTKVLLIARFARDDAEARALLEEACRPDAEYSAFAVAVRDALGIQGEDGAAVLAH